MDHLGKSNPHLGRSSFPLLEHRDDCLGLDRIKVGKLAMNKLINRSNKFLMIRTSLVTARYERFASLICPSWSTLEHIRSKFSLLKLVADLVKGHVQAAVLGCRTTFQVVGPTIRKLVQFKIILSQHDRCAADWDFVLIFKVFFPGAALWFIRPGQSMRVRKRKRPSR